MTQGPVDEVEAHRMPLMEHLRELRRRLMIAMGALAVGMVVSLAFTDAILAFLTAPVTQALADAGVEGGLSIVSSPFEGVYVYLRAAFLGALVFASPIVSAQVWLFIAPGLYKEERRTVIPLTLSSTALFLMGAAFAYWVIFPYAFPFFFTVIDAQVSLSMEGYLGAVIRMMGAFGLCFQMPIVAYFAARVGLIDHIDLLRGFRYALVVIFIIAAIITPPDVITQVLLAIPMIILYGVGIVVAWLFTTKVRD